MKKKESRNGFVLVVALILTLAVGIVTVGLIGLTMQETRLAIRSSAHSKAFHAAESGANLACEEFVKQMAGGSAWSGWSSSGTTKSISSSLTNASGTVLFNYSVSASLTGTICTITSTGQVSLAGETIRRAVRITIQAEQTSGPGFKYGLLSKSQISMAGSVRVDSFDSTDPAKSTNGQYDPAKDTRNATMATLTTNNPAISVTGGAQLNGVGCLSVVPGATVSIANWIPYTGAITYDAAQAIEDVVVPISTSATGSVVVGPWPNQSQTITVSGSQDMSVTNLTISASGKLTITGSGTLRIHVADRTAISGSGQLRIVPSPTAADLKVEMYANGNVSIGGSGVVNNTYLASNFSIWGTENCTNITVTGNSRYVGTIYAPYATISLTGSSGATGAFLGNAVLFTGASGYHIDESLIGGTLSSSSSGSSKPYRLIGWTEL